MILAPLSPLESIPDYSFFFLLGESVFLIFSVLMGVKFLKNTQQIPNAREELIQILENEDFSPSKVSAYRISLAVNKLKTAKTEILAEEILNQSEQYKYRIDPLPIEESFKKRVALFVEMSRE